MEQYVEVIGAGSVKEQVAEYRAELSLTVRAAQSETAITQVGELRDKCIRALRDAGLRDDELKEGGAAVWRPWFWKKEPGQEASHKILVSSIDASRLMLALRRLEPLLDNKRFAINVNMLTPKFSAPEAAHRAAQTAAIADARTKATALAAEAQVRILGVVQIEEVESRKSRSGAYGDEDWGMYAVAGAASAPVAAEMDPEPLDPATREHTYRFRVRFAVG